MLKVVVVVPTYNERDNIKPLFERVSRAAASLDAELHVLFVDDASDDGTAREVEKLAQGSAKVHLLERGQKKGLGTAYLDGFRRAIAAFAPTVFVQMDADLQHPPEKVGPLVSAIQEGADVAVGSRYIEGGSFRGLTLRRRLVSRGANLLARGILGLGVHDATSGFKALNRGAVEVLLGVQLHSRGFIFQVESLYLLKKRGLRTVEVPYVFEERSRGSSKMSVGEIWEFLESVLAIRFRRYRETDERRGL